MASEFGSGIASKMSPLTGLIWSLALICACSMTQIAGQPLNTTESLSSIKTELQSITASAAPSTIEEAFSTLSAIFDGKNVTVFTTAAQLISSGLSSLSLDAVPAYIAGFASGLASSANVNSREPVVAVYPRASADDAPYSITETALRSAIHIPDAFQYGAPGAPQPVLLLGGTGNSAYVTFVGTYIPLLQSEETSFGDPVWLNIPGSELDDLQKNAVYVAYAVNYLSGGCGNRSITVMGFSQGNLDAQWACKS